MNVFSGLLESFSQLISKFKDTITLGIEKRIDAVYSFWVRFSKILFINLFFLALSIFFTLAGLILVPFSIILFSSWESQTRMAAGVIIGFVYIIAGIFISLWVFEKTRWERMFRRK